MSTASPAQTANVIMKLANELKEFKGLSPGSRNTVTSALPELLSNRKYRGLHAGVLIPEYQGEPQARLVGVYEQLCWWKLKGGMDRQAVRVLKEDMAALIGKWACMVVASCKDPLHSICLFVWAVGHACNLEFNYDSQNACVVRNAIVFGVEKGKLVSVYIADYEIAVDLKSFETQELPYTFRNCPALVVVNSRGRRNPELNAFCKLAYLLLGPQGLQTVYDTATGTGVARQLSPGKTYRLYSACKKALWNQYVEPVGSLKVLLVPGTLTSSVFTKLFGRVGSSTHPPGKIRRRKLQAILNSLFPVESDQYERKNPNRPDW